MNDFLNSARELANCLRDNPVLRREVESLLDPQSTRDDPLARLRVDLESKRVRPHEVLAAINPYLR